MLWNVLFSRGKGLQQMKLSGCGNLRSEDKMIFDDLMRQRELYASHARSTIDNIHAVSTT
jgi:hypothetical protein